MAIPRKLAFNNEKTNDNGKTQFSSSSKSSKIREDADCEIVSMASQVSISSVKHSYRAPSPMTPSSPIASCRTPRRRLLLHSVDNSPQLSPVEAISSSPVEIQRRVASKLTFSPDTSQKSLDITSAVQKIQLNQTGGRCFLFPRTSSWEDDGKSAEDVSMLPSPIDLDNGVRKSNTHCRERIDDSAFNGSESEASRDSGMASLRKSSLWLRRHRSGDGLTSSKIVEEERKDSILDSSSDSLLDELEEHGCLSPGPDKLGSAYGTASMEKIDAFAKIKPEKCSMKRQLYPGKESIATSRSKKRRPPPAGDVPLSLQPKEDSSLDSPDYTSNLLPDGSGKNYSLPTTQGRHPDLKFITGGTISDLLDGLYDNLDFQIIDSRYPYEYEGGHISAASNLYTEDLIKEQLQCDDGGKTNGSVLIFHCEFSAERGPRMMRFLRSVDRSLNEYPKLRYPEIYLLEGGYNKFYESFRRHCQPQKYVKMLDRNHAEDLKEFRRKTRSLIAAEVKMSDKLEKMRRTRSGLKF